MSVVLSDEFTAFENRAVIKVVGIGGGGGNAVGRMISAGMREVEFITINTDAQALRHSPAGTRLQIGMAGLGAGAKPELGEQAAQQDRERIAEVLRGSDMTFLTAGLGGGTGTGAIPVVAEVAQDTGALTVAVVTLPFSFEGAERMSNALKGLELLQKHVDAAIVVPNDRLSALCQNNISFLDAFSLADEVLHNGVRAITELITVPGLINLDFADVRTILQASGRALMGIGTAEGEQRAIRAAQEAIVCPLLENTTIEGATRLIVNIQGGRDIGMREVHNAVTTVQKAAHPGANIIFGAVIDEAERPELRVTVIAAGFVEKALGHVEPVEVDAGRVVPFEALPKTHKRPEPAQVAVAAGSVSNLRSHQQRKPVDPPVQIMFPEPEPVDPYAAPGHNEESDEDLDIPAFMRRRMKR